MRGNALLTPLADTSVCGRIGGLHNRSVQKTKNKPVAAIVVARYRAEGEEQALSIRADADRQKEEILSTAYKQAEKTKGEGDAESTRIYGQAYSRNPRLYKFLRTLESYKKVLDDKTTAILSSDSELLKILMRGQAGAQ